MRRISEIFSSKHKIPNLSTSYADPAVAVKQRELVDRQLMEMRQGAAPQHFQVIGQMLAELKVQKEIGKVTILDAGCGSAYYSEIINHFGHAWVRYLGVDFNKGMLNLARQYYPAVPLARMDLRNMAIQQESCDLVLSGAVIVHIKEWQSAVEELVRITKRWTLLHRTVIYRHKATSVQVEHHYERNVYRVRINEQDLLSLMDDLGMGLVMKYDAGEGEVTEEQGNNSYLFERRGSDKI